MHKKKTLILTLVFSLLIPLTVFSIMDEGGAFDTRSQAQTQLMEQFRGADIDNNSKVDLADFEIWLQMWKGYRQNKSSYSSDADLDKNGGIGLSDFALWLEQWRGYKAYATNSFSYAQGAPDGLSSVWSFDQQAGSGSFLMNMFSNMFNGTPFGSEYFSYGAFGSSRLMGLGDGIGIENGDDLVSGDGNEIFSFWANMFDNSMYNLGENPNALVWDNTNDEFSMMSSQDLGMDITDLIAMFENIDIEGMMNPANDGWFNIIASMDSGENVVDYYVNGSSVGDFDFSQFGQMGDFTILSLFPQGDEVAVDNMQFWGGDSGVDVQTVFANSSYDGETSEDEDNSGEESTLKELMEDSFVPEPSPLAGKNCKACSSKYMYIAIYWNDGTHENEGADKDVCAESNDDERFAVDSSAVYWCARCEGTTGEMCEGKPCPTADDMFFAQHYMDGEYYIGGKYYNTAGGEPRTAYDRYVINCIDDRTDKGCQPLNACPNTNYRQCSDEYKYANQIFDSGSATGNYVFRCNCECGNGSTDVMPANWDKMGTRDITYEKCVEKCDDPTYQHLYRY